MNRFFTLLLAASCLTAVGQVTYPYNPDGNADGDIAVGDLQDFLGTYGNPFSPSEIMVGDSSLTYWVEQLSQTIQEQQEMIELLQYGNSKNLAFPDGFGGDFIVLNISDEEYTVPLDKNFFITNQYSQNALPRITVDDIPVFEVDGGTLATSQFGSGSTYIVGGGSVLGYTPIVNASPVVNFSGILVDRGVEPIVVDLLQEDFVVPQGYNLHLMSVYSEGSGSGFAQVDGVELFRMGSNSTMWQNLIGGQVIASGNQTVSLVSTGNLELANLSCYLAPIDHFGGVDNPVDSEGENAEFVSMDIDSHPDGSVVFVNENTDVLFIDHDSNGGTVRRGLVLPSGLTEKKLRVMVTPLNGNTYFPLFESQSFTNYDDSNSFWEFQHKDEANRFFVLIRGENGRWYLSYGS